MEQHQVQQSKDWRFDKDYDKELIIDNVERGVRTPFYRFGAYLSVAFRLHTLAYEHKRGRIGKWLGIRLLAMQEELIKFGRNNLWNLFANLMIGQ